ncbi:spore germination protein [Effusibacillus pohliae]|uniref:spore germination protein n=1 Tax=Effusibacillus pohliae TaxID=232270 RepID=UPI00036CA461|nr:spore germination protein [Effusibacillus pohliae]
MNLGVPVATKLDTLSPKLAENLQVFRSIYADCSDVVFRPFFVGGRNAMLLYIDGLSNVEEIDRGVLQPLMQVSKGDAEDLDTLMKTCIGVSQVQKVDTVSDCTEQIGLGNPVLFLEGETHGLAFGLQKWEKRSVEEPTAELVIRGPREGFTETLRDNTSLLRRRLRHPNLKLRSMKIGRYSQTQVVIAYVEGIVDPTLVEEVMARLQRIDIDGVLESGYIEEMIEDNPFSPFPQMINTERPDVAAAGLLEGRVVILVDGTPFGLIVPTTLYSLLQSAEDYYQTFTIGTAIRWMRYLFFVASLLLPSLYVAVLTFHQEMVPTTLLISMARSREEIPFPALVEALMMEVVFEALREAGARLPKQVGAAVSIVGALVIGEAAVSAGIVSAPMVMVVSITGIASFIVPRYTAGIALRLLRFPMIMLAGTLGLLGIMLGIIVIVVHLCSLRSFGVPYLSPLAPIKGHEIKDVLVRAPWWKLNRRPHLTGEFNEYRQAPGQKPDPTDPSES